MDPSWHDSLREIRQYYWLDLEGGTPDTSTTLHASAQNPNVLRYVYVLLFGDAKSRWGQDGIIFVKSNPGLLPVSPPRAVHPPTTGSGHV